MSDRPTLIDPAMLPVWDLVRARLERRGLDNRGRIRLPPLAATARLALSSLLGRPVGKTLDLAVLERSLQALAIGDALPEALAALGRPVSDEPALRREANRTAGLARAAARQAAAPWPEPWAATWIDEVIRAGGLRRMDAAAAVQLVGRVRAILDHLGGFLDGAAAGSIGRVDLAAQLFGSSHALDTGTRLEAAATRALAHRLGEGDARDLWARAGAHLDLTSGPVLTWRLPLDPRGALASIVEASTSLGLPHYLTQFALRQHPVIVAPGANVLVVENPRVVEAAAQRRFHLPVIATNGNPSGAVLLLLTQLLDSRARLRCHGDFDTAGLAICGRLHQLGLVPWHMDASRYLAALEDADADGLTLPVDLGAVPSTPWDPRLEPVFAARRRVVHEERLLDEILAAE